MRDSIQIRVLKNVGGFKAGQVIRTPCDERGKPTNVFWIRRLIEAKRDQCCKIIPEKEPEATKQPTAENTTDAPEKTGTAKDGSAEAPQQ